MGPVIYSANPLQLTFWFSLVCLIFSVWAGYAAFYSYQLGEAWWNFRRSPITRGAAAVFLFLVGVAFALVWLQLIVGGSKTITVQLNDKQTSTENCGKDQTCTHYVLKVQSDSKFYRLEIPEDTYKKAKVQSCYEVTYYSVDGLDVESGNSYLLLSSVTRIESTACP